MKALPLIVGAWLLCVGCVAAADLPTDIEAAQSASIQSQSKHPDYYGKVLQPFFYEKVLSQCVQHSFEDKGAFVVVLALDADGKVIRVYESSKTRVSSCLDAQVAKIVFPKPPAAPFFAAFDMRFEK